MDTAITRQGIDINTYKRYITTGNNMYKQNGMIQIMQNYIIYTN